MLVNEQKRVTLTVEERRRHPLPGGSATSD
jgi:hypothetical protein